jgi:type II secretory pathway pseudopilin PulG
MRNPLDFTSWQGLLSTLLGLVLVSLVAVGIRIVVMLSVQQRRERQNRQINERLKTLIAAYKVLGGSFTGELAVDPSHLRDLRVRQSQGRAGAQALDAGESVQGASENGLPASDRRRRIRDAVESALSDVILLGTEAQVRLAAQAASDMAAGRRVETAELVVSLRTFIREVLDLAPVPPELGIPKQGPLRTKGTPARSDRAGGGGVGGGSTRGGAGGAGMGAGLGVGVGLHHGAADAGPAPTAGLPRETEP